MTSTHSLTATQLRGLFELQAACDETIELRPLWGGWVKTRQLCGTAEERSATNMKSLVAIGLCEGRKYGVSRQEQWRWRVTDSGRAVIAEALKGNAQNE